MLCYTLTVRTRRKVRASFVSSHSACLVPVVYCSVASAGTEGEKEETVEQSERSQQEMSQVSVPAIECHRRGVLNILLLLKMSEIGLA